MTLAATINASQDYRRQARRLRGRLARQPVELYHSLRELSDRHDASCLQRAEDESRIDPTLSSDFAQEVSAQLNRGVLPYSRRVELLRRADELGIGRFQANLIIAAVQHRFGQASPSTTDCASPSPFPLAAVLTFSLVQLLILAAAWVMFVR